MTMQKGDIFTKTVMILKIKHDKPTVISMDGRVYTWMPDDKHVGKGGKKK